MRKRKHLKPALNIRRPFQTRIKTRSGFTLIELMLYMSLLAMMIFTISFFISMILQSRIKNQTIAEVEQQGSAIMQILAQTIRNAQNITTPTQGQTSTSLVLVVPDTTKSPTVVDFSAGALRFQEGNGTALPLTSSKITVSNLGFQNLSRSNTPATIRIIFTLTYTNPSVKNEYNYSKTFYGSANLRLSP